MTDVTVPRRARVNGLQAPLEEATVSVLDEGFTRGDGAFETVGVWDGRPFRLDDHLERLAASMGKLGLAAPDREAFAADVHALLDGIDADAALRLYATGSGTRVVTLDAQPVRNPPRRLASQPAPWIRPLGTWAPAGAKSMSYLWNMAATRAANADGADDALLLTLEGYAAEGPTFAVCWVRDGTLHTPAVELGIVDSISRRVVVDCATARGIPVVAGRWHVADLYDADEVLVSSAVRPLLAVHELDGHPLEAGPIGVDLADELEAWRRGRREEPPTAAADQPGAATAGAEPPASVSAPDEPPASASAPAEPTADPNMVAIERADIPGDAASWLQQVAEQVDPRLDQVEPAWQEREQAPAARACAFGLLLGYLAGRYPHMRGDLDAVAEAHPSFSTLIAGSRLSTLEQLAGDRARMTAWLGPLVGTDDADRVGRLLQ